MDQTSKDIYNLFKIALIHIEFVLPSQGENRIFVADINACIIPMVAIYGKDIVVWVDGLASGGYTSSRI